MKLATLKNGKRDGQLVVVSRDMRLAAPAGPATLQAALDDWASAEPELLRVADQLAAGTAPGAMPFDPAHAAAPLPRAYQWLDASAFIEHGALMSQAFRKPNPQGDTPLMYQGASDDMLGPHDDVPFPNEACGIDFEGELGLILDETPMAATEAEAAGAIRLLVLLNDWSLRALTPAEMRSGFGFLQSKTVTSFAPVAITPDELGAAWLDHRVHLPLHVTVNGDTFGSPHAGGMHFSFIDLIRYATATRRLRAGTILGSGTISQGDPDRVGSACIAEKRGRETIVHGDAVTPFLKFGDRVRLDMLDAAGHSVFGTIEQRVIESGARA